MLSKVKDIQLQQSVTNNSILQSKFSPLISASNLFPSSPTVSVCHIPWYLGTSSFNHWTITSLLCLSIHIPALSGSPFYSVPLRTWHCNLIIPNLRDILVLAITPTTSWSINLHTFQTIPVLHDVLCRGKFQ